VCDTAPLSKFARQKQIVHDRHHAPQLFSIQPVATRGALFSAQDHTATPIGIRMVRGEVMPLQVDMCFAWEWGAV